MEQEVVSKVFISRYVKELLRGRCRKCKSRMNECKAREGVYTVLAVGSLQLAVLGSEI